MTTTLTAWLFGFLRRYSPPRSIPRLAFSMLTLFGLLDLPLYVILPRIGLRHLIVIGGAYTEPLIGARLMGGPDFLTYGLMGLSTLGLILLWRSDRCE
ncbi:MAG: hypothetical protein ACE5I5_12210 [Candidatus Heimdallarchaeota archaeon]